jgi:hypothetical protein
LTVAVMVAASMLIRSLLPLLSLRLTVVALAVLLMSTVEVVLLSL